MCSSLLVTSCLPYTYFLLCFSYQKTGMAFKNFGSFASRKLGEVRGTTTFKSIEEKVGDAYTSVKVIINGVGVVLLKMH